MYMLEFDSAFSDGELNRIVNTAKIQKQAQAQHDAFDSYFEFLENDFQPGTLSKAAAEDAADILYQDELVKGFGIESYTIPQPQIDLDGLEKADSPQLKLTARLMKAERNRLASLGKSTGLPSEEMTNFYERYKHLFHKTVQDAIVGAIRCLDFSLFARLMSEGLAASH
jgi:hypothetical protein